MDFVTVRAALLRRRLPIYLHARAIGMAEGRLLRILSGRTPATPDELRQILEPLDLTAADLEPTDERRVA